MVLAGVHLAGRYSDLARLRVCDVERTDEGLKVTPWVRKNWPGGTPDGLWLVRTDNAQLDPVAAMDEWLAERSQLGPGWLFPAWRAGGWVVDEPVSYDHYSAYLAALGAAAGVGPVTSHTLRRSTAQLLWDQGANEAELMRLLGHRDTRTLNRYLRKERSAGAGGQIVERYVHHAAGNA
jgi:integrase